MACQPNSNTSAPGATSASQCVCNPGFVGTSQCAFCSPNSYCAGGAQTAACPTGLYSVAGATSAAQCSCPAQASLVGSTCVCAAGLLQVTNAAAQLGGWECDACPPNDVCVSGVASACPTGSYCVSGIANQCPANSFCVGGVATACPANMHSAAGASACVCADGYAGSPCAQCPANTYCTSGVQTSCPIGATSPAGSASMSACTCQPGYYVSKGTCVLCPAGAYCSGGSITSSSAFSGCPAGSYCPAGASSPTTCASLRGAYCPANSSTLNLCAAGFYCTSASGPQVVCPTGAYCVAGSLAPVTCTVGTYSTALQQTSSAACVACTTCTSGSFQVSACAPAANRVCQACTGAPAQASYITSSTACQWVCNNGYAGSTCAQCSAGYWCASGIANQCPLNSYSSPGAYSQNDCTCNPGYTSQGTITSSSPCVLCKSGTVCPGGGTVAVTVTSTPQTGVPAQVVLVQQTLPPADSLVALFQSIPTALKAIQAALPAGSGTVSTRQVCRGSYCVSCDGTANCVPLMWVGVSQGQQGKYAYNVSAVPADTLLTFVVVTPGLCTPTINLQSEYESGLQAVVSSISSITSIPLVCSSNALVGTSLSVSGTTSALSRRLLQAGRRLLQQTIVNSLHTSVVVPQNLTEATQTAIASANLTIEGYSPIAPVVVNHTNNNSVLVFTCPANATSPRGAVSVSQCVCLPGYEGNAAAGTPCTPCAPNVFCSNGLVGLCPGNASAPALSNSSANCACNPGFYSTMSPPTACYPCPVNAYCPGGEAIVQCVDNAVAPAGSTSPDDCYCAAGFAGVKDASCSPCSPGFWCWTGVSNPCPLNMTSNASATRVSNCFCADGYAAVQTKTSSGTPTTACLLCAQDTYCKVRTQRIRI